MTKYENAIESVKTYYALAFSGRLSPIGETIVDVLERTIPKAPVIVMKEFNSYDKVGEPCIIKYQCRTCPTCGSTLMNHGKGWICSDSNCRQAIDQELCEVV